MNQKGEVLAIVLLAITILSLLGVLAINASATDPVLLSPQPFGQFQADRPYNYKHLSDSFFGLLTWHGVCYFLGQKRMDVITYEMAAVPLNNLHPRSEKPNPKEREVKS